MPGVEYRVTEDSYEIGKVYTIIDCGDILKAKVIADVEDGYLIEDVAGLINVQQMSSALTVICDENENRYYALVKLGWFKEDSDKFVKSKLFPVDDLYFECGSWGDTVAEKLKEFARLVEIPELSSKKPFKTYGVSVSHYIRNTEAQKFIDDFIELSSCGNPYLMTYVKDGELYFVFLTEECY